MCGEAANADSAKTSSPMGPSFAGSGNAWPAEGDELAISWIDAQIEQ
jgi:hypothetical protein